MTLQNKNRIYSLSRTRTDWRAMGAAVGLTIMMVAVLIK